jgi:hypothetical protein
MGPHVFVKPYQNMMAWHFGKHETQWICPPNVHYILHHDEPLHFEENWVPKI